MGRVFLLISAIFTLRVAAAQPPRVAVVYPRGPTISSHTLRILIRFTMPVMTETLPRLHLVNSEGREIQHAFLPQELWSPDRRVLTVLFDPARLKTGVGKHDTLGGPLNSSSRVELLLGTMILKSWQIASSPCRGMSSREWKRAIPVSGTREPLRITFPESVDYAASRSLIVVDFMGHRVQGHSLLTHHERQWIFRPSHPWIAGRFHILANSMFETPCGDRYRHPFEEFSSDESEHTNDPTEICEFFVSVGVPTSERFPVGKLPPDE